MKINLQHRLHFFQINTFEYKKQDELTFNLKKYLFEVSEAARV